MPSPNRSTEEKKLRNIAYKSAAAILLLLLSGRVLTASFIPSGNLLTPRQHHTATPLPDGKALVAGGSNDETLSSSELYDPKGFRWYSSAGLHAPRKNHSATPLSDGSVLVAGGSNGTAILASTELYNTAERRWSPAGHLDVARQHHTATRLADGTVLVAGGENEAGPLASAERLDPAANRWTFSKNLSSPRTKHNATLLADGRVLVTGGFDGARTLASTELFDLATGKWSPAGDLETGRQGHTATLLADGRVLVTGGFDGTEYLATTEIYDPDTRQWAPSGRLNAPRAGHTTTLLSDGNILVAGGTDGVSPLPFAERYDPATDRWSAISGMVPPRTGHTATLIADGTVLLAGGAGPDGSLTSTELFTPDSTASDGTSGGTTASPSPTTKRLTIPTLNRVRAGDYPTLQAAYEQTPDNDVLMALDRTYGEDLHADRPVTVTLAGGYADTTYTGRSGLSTLQGTLTIGSGTLIVDRLVITSPGSGGPVTIGNVSVGSINTDAATVSWSTNQPATSRVDYGETIAYGNCATDATLTTSHSLTLTGLSPGATYHFAATSVSAFASTATSADGTFTVSNFAITTTGDSGSVSVMEVTGTIDAKLADGTLNTYPRQEIARNFNNSHGDSYDFIVIAATLPVAMPEAGAKGFYLGARNNTQGIGQAVFDNSAQFGSAGKLQGTIDLGDISAASADPLDPTFDKLLTTLSHEIMHRWGSYVTYKKADNSISSALLGKDGSHWSYLLDSAASFMYGSAWRDNGNGTFTAYGATNGYSPLDLYLMGMIDKTQVPSMLLIDNPAIDKTQLPQAGATISGTATTVTIDDIVAAEGERVPAAAQAQKEFKIGFVLLIPPGGPTGNALATIEALKKA